VVKVEGRWATIRTPGGAEGFVHRSYLSYPGGQAPPEVAVSPRIEVNTQPSPTPAPRAESIPTPASAADPMRTLREENARLSAEVNALRDQLAARAVEAAPAPASAAGTVAPNQELRGDVQRLLQMTEEIRSLARARPSEGGDTGAAPLPSGDSWLASNGWVLAASVVVGGLLGSVYGRFQERRRRNRIRF
jgi:hypothetical protein